MTELQILRNSLFDEITRLKRGTTTPNDSMAIVKVANAIISSYNTELKAISTLIQASEHTIAVPELKIFTEDIHKNAINYAAIPNEES